MSNLATEDFQHVDTAYATGSRRRVSSLDLNLILGYSHLTEEASIAKFKAAIEF